MQICHSRTAVRPRMVPLGLGGLLAACTGWKHEASMADGTLGELDRSLEDAWANEVDGEFWVRKAETVVILLKLKYANWRNRSGLARDPNPSRSCSASRQQLRPIEGQCERPICLNDPITMVY